MDDGGGDWPGQKGGTRSDTEANGDDAFASDMLVGARAIAKHWFGNDDDKHRRKIYHLVEKGRFPHFTMGSSTIHCRRSVLRAFVEAQERENAEGKKSGRDKAKATEQIGLRRKHLERRDPSASVANPRNVSMETVDRAGILHDVANTWRCARLADETDGNFATRLVMHLRTLAIAIEEHLNCVAAIEVEISKEE